VTSGARARGIWLLVAVLAVLHFVLRAALGVGGGAPDLLTIALLLAAREVRVGAAGGIGLCFGLLEDALSVLAFGANSVAMTAVAILGALTRDLFVGDSRLFVVSYLFVGKWVRDLLRWLLLDETLRLPFADQVLAQGALAAAYAAAAGLVLLTLAGRRADA
jgi:rod shape-determining protein MreD